MSAPSAYQVRILGALQKKADRGEVYMGTVSKGVVQRRRAANRVARRQRRVNRARGGK